METERQRYQDLFEFVPDGYLVTDAEGTIREANRGAAELLGIPSGLLLGKSLALFVAAEARSTFRSQLNRLLQAGPAGSEFWMALAARVIPVSWLSPMSTPPAFSSPRVMAA